MKVLHISTPRSWRGGEQQLTYLMVELALKGIEQSLFCPGGSVMERVAKEQGIRTAIFTKRMSFDPFAAYALHRFAQEENISLIHTHDSHAHTLAVLAASLFRFNVPIIVSRRVDFPVRTTGVGGWKYRHRNVQGYISVSQAINDVMIASGVEPGLLSVVHSGIDIHRFRKSPDGRLRSEFGLSVDTPLVGNVSAIAPHKDYRTFVKTAELLLQRGVDAYFMIIGGDGGEEEEIRDYVQGKGLSDRILFTGFRTDIEQILPELDLFLITSKTEGLGTTILDAFAAGVPVIATRGGGIGEIVLHQQSGLIADVGEAEELAHQVESVLTDPQLGSKLIEGGREEVKKYSKEKTAEKTLEVYRRVLTAKESDTSH